MTSKVAFPMLELRRHEQAIIAAVCVAGERLVAMQPAICDTRQLAVKADGTIVTPADNASEDILLAVIQRHAPRPHQVVSEERLASPIADPAQSTWFIDPLDGTRSYASGSPDFAILVSEWAAGAARFSVVHYPAFGQLAVAVGGRATWTPTIAQPRKCADVPAMGMVHLCYMESKALRRLVTEAGVKHHEAEAESTRALLDVVTGTASAAVVFLCGHKSWDLAPLLHLVTAAGGFVSDETGRPVRIRGPEVFGCYVIAARESSWHGILTAALRKLATTEI